MDLQCPYSYKAILKETRINFYSSLSLLDRCWTIDTAHLTLYQILKKSVHGTLMRNDSGWPVEQDYSWTTFEIHWHLIHEIKCPINTIVFCVSSRWKWVQCKSWFPRLAWKEVKMQLIATFSFCWNVWLNATTGH